MVPYRRGMTIAFRAEGETGCFGIKEEGKLLSFLMTINRLGPSSLLTKSVKAHPNKRSLALEYEVDGYDIGKGTSPCTRK
jgi:hypothetical protein